jgi:hypothetical protein
VRDVHDLFVVVVQLDIKHRYTYRHQIDASNPTHTSEIVDANPGRRNGTHRYHLRYSISSYSVVLPPMVRFLLEYAPASTRELRRLEDVGGMQERQDELG